MKLVRYGAPGREKPGIIDADGKIYMKGLGVMGLTDPKTWYISDNNTISGGAAGTGGAGGYSIVHAGGSGTAGQLAGCSFN